MMRMLKEGDDDDDDCGVYDDDDGYDDVDGGDDNEEAKHDDKNSLLSCHLPRRPGRLRVPRCKRNGRGRNETCQPEDTCLIFLHNMMEIQRHRPF